MRVHLPLVSLILILSACADGDGTDSTDTDPSGDTDLPADDTDAAPGDTDAAPGDTDDTDDTDGPMCRTGPLTDNCLCVEWALPDGDAACRAVQVYILDDHNSDVDDSSGVTLATILDAEGAFTVTRSLVRMDDWDGTLPATTDVVFWASGVRYRNLDDDGGAALRAFVGAGGGLIRTEWGTAYSEHLLELSPVDATESDYNYDEEVLPWALVPAPRSDAAEAIVAGLPATFDVLAGITQVNLRDHSNADTDLPPAEPDPEVVIELTSDGAPFPAVTWWPAAPHRGPIVHFNHDLRYQEGYHATEPLTEPEVHTLIRNIVFAAAAFQ